MSKLIKPVMVETAVMQRASRHTMKTFIAHAEGEKSELWVEPPDDPQALKNGLLQLRLEVHGEEFSGKGYVHLTSLGVRNLLREVTAWQTEGRWKSVDELDDTKLPPRIPTSNFSEPVWLALDTPDRKVVRGQCLWRTPTAGEPAFVHSWFYDHEGVSKHSASDPFNGAKPVAFAPIEPIEPPKYRV
jgi:hypothetical protein